MSAIFFEFTLLGRAGSTDYCQLCKNKVFEAGAAFASNATRVYVAYLKEK